MTTILRDDGTIVPFMPIENSGIINSYWMQYDDYALLPEVFCQRNTLARLLRARKHLAKLLPEHCIVFLARLTKDDRTEHGDFYPAGTIFRLDSNTRAKNWAEAGSDMIPQSLFVIEFSYDSCARIQDSYNTFDSPDATERSQEKVYGIFTGNYGFYPTCKKFLKGQILTALHKACQLFDPVSWGDQNYAKPAEVIGQIGTFLPELKHLDTIITDSTSWDQHILCAGLLALKKHGTNNETLNEALTFINDKSSNTRDPKKSYDGVTHIILEWDRDVRFPNKNTKFKGRDNLDDTLPFLLYCIDKYVDGVPNKKINAPETYALEYVRIGDQRLKQKGDLSLLFA